MQTATRNASLADLAELLKSQHARKVDVVAPASKVRSESGVLVVEGADPEVTPEGVTLADGRYMPTAVCDEGIADKLGIPLPYVRRLRAERPDLYDANVNGWLHGAEDVAPDSRAFLLRCFRSDQEEGGTGIARAFLSDRYAVIDHLDALTAALDGVRQSGAEVKIDGCDLTERRMTVRIQAPEVQALAPTLLRGYRSPFSGASGDENPTVFAGFQISNSETGGGAFTIVPRLTVQVCNNGMTLTKDAIRAVHLGGRLDAGVIRWSEETQEKNVELIRLKTADAVRTFLDVDYMREQIAKLEEEAGRPIEKVDDVKTIGKRLSFTQDHIDGVLDHFVRGGQMTAGGVMNAVTSYAQTVQEADVAYDLEQQALRVLEVAGR